MLIKEGKASIKVNESAFYNPKMKGLRDLSVLFLKSMHLRKYSLLDSTAATGIRGIRYRLEAGAGKIVLLDINKKAYLSAKQNAKSNNTGAVVLNQSIQEFCNTNNETFDVIDLDPFGTAAPYIYDLMKVAKEGTVLMATATDTAVLCGATPLACIKTYGAQPLHNELCQEAGIRIMINYIAKIASQFNFGIDVKLAIANLHYMRVFIVLSHGAKEAVESVKNTGFGVFCGNCRDFGYSKGIAPRLSSVCKNCKSDMQLFGPLWLGGIYDKTLIRQMSTNVPKDIDANALRVLKEIDAELDLPFFYSIPKITRLLGISSVSQAKVVGILSKGYKVTKTHFDNDGIKTDAPISIITRAVKRV
ncbi:MAG: tRNA (guanine(10)-N(2))-dimethyltransferase [Candidatus Micrarchaeales archaeon]